MMSQPLEKNNKEMSRRQLRQQRTDILLLTCRGGGAKREFGVSDILKRFLYIYSLLILWNQEKSSPSRTSHRVFFTRTKVQI